MTHTAPVAVRNWLSLGPVAFFQMSLPHDSLPQFPLLCITWLAHLRRLAKTRGVPHSSVMQLLATVLREFPVNEFVHSLEAIEPLQVWHDMREADFVEVLTAVAQKRSVHGPETDQQGPFAKQRRLAALASAFWMQHPAAPLVWQRKAIDRHALSATCTICYGFAVVTVCQYDSHHAHSGAPEKGSPIMCTRC